MHPTDSHGAFEEGFYADHEQRETEDDERKREAGLRATKAHRRDDSRADKPDEPLSQGVILGQRRDARGRRFEDQGDVKNRDQHPQPATAAREYREYRDHGRAPDAQGHPGPGHHANDPHDARPLALGPCRGVDGNRRHEGRTEQQPTEPHEVADDVHATNKILEHEVRKGRHRHQNRLGDVRQPFADDNPCGGKPRQPHEIEVVAHSLGCDRRHAAKRDHEAHGDPEDRPVEPADPASHVGIGMLRRCEKCDDGEDEQRQL